MKPFRFEREHFFEFDWKLSIECNYFTHTLCSVVPSEKINLHEKHLASVYMQDSNRDNNSPYKSRDVKLLVLIANQWFHDCTAETE